MTMSEAGTTKTRPMASHRKAVTKAWRDANWRELWPVSLASTLAIPFGVMLLVYVDALILRWLICALLFFATTINYVDRSVLENMRSAAPSHMGDAEVRGILGSFMFSGDDVSKPAGVLSGGEKTRLALATIVASSANVLLLDEPTNNLDPASRAEILSALSNFSGAVVMVSHDEGAVAALNPDRVVLLPDGDEDLWNDSYLELVTLA